MIWRIGTAKIATPQLQFQQEKWCGGGSGFVRGGCATGSFINRRALF
jgi:hypothetical protein